MTTTIDKPAIEITQYNAVKAEVAELRRLNASLAFKYEDPKDNKNARSHIFKMRTKKADVERVRKSANADALDYTRRVNSVAKELTAELDSMIDVHQKPIDAIDLAEANRKAEEERKALEAQAAIDRAERAKQEAALAAERAEAAKVKAERDALLQQQAEAERAVREEREAAETLAREEREAKERRALKEAARVKNEKVRKAIIREIADSLFATKMIIDQHIATDLATLMLDGKIARVSIRTDR